MKKRCRIGFHPWSEWTKPKYLTNKTEFHTTKTGYQERTCPACKMVQTRETHY